jgi:hypothetical protein
MAPSRPELQHGKGATRLKRRTKSADPFEGITMEIARDRVSFNCSGKRLDSLYKSYIGQPAEKIRDKAGPPWTLILFKTLK